MSFEKEAFRSLRPLREAVDILVGNNERIPAEGEGDVPLDTEHGSITLRNVLYVPQLAANLISYTRLMRRCAINGSKTGATIYAPGGHKLLTTEEWQGVLRANARQRHYDPGWADDTRQRIDDDDRLSGTEPATEEDEFFPNNEDFVQTGREEYLAKGPIEGHRSLVTDSLNWWTQAVARQRVRERIDSEAAKADGAYNAPPTQDAVHGTAQPEPDDQAQDLAQAEQAVQELAQAVQVVQDPVQTEQGVPGPAHDEQADEDPAHDERADADAAKETLNEGPGHETTQATPFKTQHDGEGPATTCECGPADEYAHDAAESQETRRGTQFTYVGPPSYEEVAINAELFNEKLNRMKGFVEDGPHGRKDYLRLVAARLDERGQVFLTAQAMGKMKEIVGDQQGPSSKQEGDVKLDHDSEGKGGGQPNSPSNPICMMSHADGLTTANFFTSRLCDLVDQRRWTSLPPEPRNVEDMLRGPYAKEWRAILQHEFDTHLERNCWELRQLPRGRRNLGVKWLLKIRVSAAELVDAIRTRLVEKGYIQVKTADFNDSCFPVSRFTLLRVLVASIAIGNADLTKRWTLWCQPEGSSIKPPCEGQAYEKSLPLYMDQITRCQDTLSLTAVDPHCQLVGYSDAYYDLNGVTMSGFVFLLGGAAVSWDSRVCPALWSIQTELNAVIHAASEALDLRSMLQEMGHAQIGPTTLFINNDMVTDLTKMETRLGFGKPPNRLNWLRRVVREKRLRLVYVNSSNQAADFLAEDFSKAPFGTSRVGMGLHLNK